MFDNYASPRLAYTTLQEAVEFLRGHDAEAVTRMVDRSLSREECTAALGNAEAYHDMMTDLGSLLIAYDEHDNFSLTAAVQRVLYLWGEKAERHRHAHKHDDTKEEAGEGVDALMALAQALFQEETPCMPMHQAAATAYETMAYHLLNVFADSLITKTS